MILQNQNGKRLNEAKLSFFSYMDELDPMGPVAELIKSTELDLDVDEGTEDMCLADEKENDERDLCTLKPVQNLQTLNIRKRAADFDSVSKRPLGSHGDLTVGLSIDDDDDDETCVASELDLLIQVLNVVDEMKCVSYIEKKGNIVKCEESDGEEKETVEIKTETDQVIKRPCQDMCPTLETHYNAYTGETTVTLGGHAYAIDLSMPLHEDTTPSYTTLTTVKSTCINRTAIDLTKSSAQDSSNRQTSNNKSDAKMFSNCNTDGYEAEYNTNGYGSDSGLIIDEAILDYIPVPVAELQQFTDDEDEVDAASDDMDVSYSDNVTSPPTSEYSLQRQYVANSPVQDDENSNDSVATTGSDVTYVPKSNRSRGRTSGSGRFLKPGCRLWEFIRNLLLDSSTNPSVICWEDRAMGVFRVVDSKEMACIWGRRKGNDGMSYEKLSRAMRYYYKRKVFEPVLGRRMLYKFGPKATGWREDEVVH